MQSGDIFTLDNDAILDMENEEFSVVWRDKAKNEHRLQPGTQFRITAKDGLAGLPLEVRAAKINPTTGKCGRGRPRRFPAAVVYRLLGETAPDPSTVVVPAPVIQEKESAAVDTASEVVEVEQPQQVEQVEDVVSQEELERQKAKVESLLGLFGDGGDDDWS